MPNPTARSYEQAAIYLGTLDTTFMVCYSIGLFISGYIGEKYSLRHVLALGKCDYIMLEVILDFLRNTTKCNYIVPVWLCVTGNKLY